jgi:transcription antitermination factor NusG
VASLVNELCKSDLPPEPAGSCCIWVKNLKIVKIYKIGSIIKKNKSLLNNYIFVVICYSRKIETIIKK